MSFNLIEIEGGLGFPEKLTIFLILIVGIFLMTTSGSLIVQFRRLHGNFKRLIGPIIEQNKQGTIEPKTLFRDEATDKELGPITIAVKEKLPDQAILDIIRILNRSLFFLDKPIRHQIRNLKVAGIGIILIGIIGTFVGAIHAFEGAAMSGSGGMSAIAGGLADSFIMLIGGTTVGMLCLGVSSFFTGKLEKLQGILSPQTFLENRKK